MALGTVRNVGNLTVEVLASYAATHWGSLFPVTSCLRRSGAHCNTLVGAGHTSMYCKQQRHPIGMTGAHVNCMTLVLAAHACMARAHKCAAIARWRRICQVL